jgi:formylglycine-generating enzyme required for sulfatase activity
MTRLIFFLTGLLLCMLTPLHAQQKIKALGYTYHRINDTLYAGEWEVSNLEYKNFLATLPAAQREECKPDSLGWAIHETLSRLPFTNHYHWHPAFESSPVVNINHAHAVRYCEWLTSLYNFKKKKNGWTFRLPTIDEWMLLADPDPQTKLPYGIGNGQNEKGCYVINVNPEGQFTSDGAMYTIGKPRRSYLLETNYFYTQSRNGLFHVIGNAAEMTTHDGVQKGGSWADDPEACYVKDVQHYSTPDARVGFRVVAVKAEKEKRQKR